MSHRAVKRLSKRRETESATNEQGRGTRHHRESKGGGEAPGWGTYAYSENVTLPKEMHTSPTL